MKEFIKSIWSGDVCPISECAINNRQINKLEELRERHRENLASRLNDEEKIIFEKYIDCTQEVISLYLEDAFVCGVRYSVQLFTEAIG